MTNTSANAGPIIDALIAGLGVSRQGLTAQCEAALRSLGGRALQFLPADADASPQRRKRMKAIAATIDEHQDLSADNGRLTYAALVLAAAVQDEQDNPTLLPALQQLGPNAVEQLVHKAIEIRRSPAASLRVLKVVKQLGGPRTPIAMQGIVLTNSRNVELREFALQLFCVWRRLAELAVSGCS